MDVKAPKLNYFIFPTPTGDWEVSLSVQGNTDWFGSSLQLDVKPAL